MTTILYDNAAIRAQTTASSTQAGTFIQNMYDGNLYDYWQPASTGVQSLLVTFTNIELINAIGIAGHNFHTTGIAVLDVNLLDEQDSVISSLQISLSSDDVHLQSVPETSVKKISIQFSVSGELPFISALIIGKAIISERKPSFGIEVPFIDNQSSVSTLRNQNGTILGRIIEQREGVKLSFTLKDVERDFVEQNWIPFLKASVGSSFFVSLSDLIGRTIFASTDEIQNPKISDQDRFDVSLKLTGIFK